MTQTEESSTYKYNFNAEERVNVGIKLTTVRDMLQKHGFDEKTHFLAKIEKGSVIKYTDLDEVIDLSQTKDFMTDRIPREDKEELLRVLEGSPMINLTRAGRFLDPEVQFISKMYNIHEFLDSLEPKRAFTIVNEPSPSMPIYIDWDNKTITALSKFLRPILITYNWEHPELLNNSFATLLAKTYEPDNENIFNELLPSDVIIKYAKRFFEEKGYIVLIGKITLH